MNYSNFTKDDFFNLDTSNFDEKQIQCALVAFFRKFIKPKAFTCVLICNPFADIKHKPQVVNRALEEGFERGNPDLLFIYRSTIVQEYTGLAIELKKDGEVIYNKKGELKNDHLKLQKLKLDSLELNGYMADFAIGYIEALYMIINYFQ